MALTIINHLIRRADTAHAAELGDGGWTLRWLPAAYSPTARAPP